MPFIDDMPAAFSRADLVICRAGAGTVSELAAAGKPSILVPLPTAADQHQLRNAEAFARSGATQLVLDHQMDGGRFFEEVRKLSSQPALLKHMGEQARTFAHPDAARRAAEVVEEAIAVLPHFAPALCRKVGGPRSSRSRRLLTFARKSKQYILKMFFKPQHLHFIGIGGIGMSGIAEVLLNLGYQITGSDLKLSATTERLARLGRWFSRAMPPRTSEAAKAVVVSSAVEPQIRRCWKRGVWTSR